MLTVLLVAEASCSVSCAVTAPAYLPACPLCSNVVQLDCLLSSSPAPPGNGRGIFFCTSVVPAFALAVARNFLGLPRSSMWVSSFRATGMRVQELI